MTASLVERLRNPGWPMPLIDLQELLRDVANALETESTGTAALTLQLSRLAERVRAIEGRQDRAGARARNYDARFPVDPPEGMNSTDSHPSPVKECRPPKQWEGEPIHWLRDHGGRVAPAKWEAGWWHFFSKTSVSSSLQMADAGWRYLAPCRPPHAD